MTPLRKGIAVALGGLIVLALAILLVFSEVRDEQSDPTPTTSPSPPPEASPVPIRGHLPVPVARPTEAPQPTQPAQIELTGEGTVVIESEPAQESPEPTQEPEQSTQEPTPEPSPSPQTCLLGICL
ncbi:MAG: hypothetical protein COT71_02065 [Candidatus Andersenbacteria bacterium CG10_big_fil_rev_8_21_14_0_10_54_11]|uniref:Uncharacterized protein n=1 Tax=Candidatus Andersenbacteria bacterium CG10_big_fil_rev_8_21_14_0_10_54_11 TaxID=1974485 RepID=A0A2M6WZJ3_9BACT|nr:MAG: hypothetical protein COT71_02065 [Candidatus Andersenbacteria bacterium CG10_big_fil_rev_8_21_14_0_10_54_11]